MEGLIILVILIPVVIIILLIGVLVRNGEQKRLLETLYDEISDLRKMIKNIGELPKVTEPAPIPQPAIEKIEIPVPIPESPPVVEEVKESYVAPKPEEISISHVKTTKEKKSKLPTDWEKFIGENLASKIGIAVLILGISFFVKYAIDKDWINEAGRVIIGLLCGAILIGLAHHFRNRYRSFSSVLVGGGLTVFYFSIAFAFHQYHLIGQTAAFIIMMIISALGVLLSLFYDRQELAILATIGGFVTPFLVSTGQENYPALFTYLCILNTGLLALAWFKRWPSINSIALFFTTIIFGGWMFRNALYGESDFPYKDALLFATLFYVQFVIISIITVLRLKEKFNTYDFSIILGINFLYYAAGMTGIKYWDNGVYSGLFTLILGLVNLLMALAFWKKEEVDKNFKALLTGLSLAFITLSVPIELDANYVTLIWISEAVIFYWLYTRTSFSLLRTASLILSVLATISLLIVWDDVYLWTQTRAMPIILNKGFITSLVFSIGSFLLCRLNKVESSFTRNTYLVVALTSVYMGGLFEIWHQLRFYYPDLSLHVIYMEAYTFAVALILSLYFRKTRFADKFRLITFLACFLIYLFNISTTSEVATVLVKKSEGMQFMGHWTGTVILAWMMYDLIRHFGIQKKEVSKKWLEYFTWSISTLGVIYLSVELYHIMFWANYRGTDWLFWENLYYKAGLSILWGVCSFAMMWLGMNKDYRPLRIVSLTLFTITLLKLFLFDIRRIPPGGKIIAFIMLGILLLAISFMYQRLKKLIIDNNGE